MKWLRYKWFFCVLKTRTLENYTLGFAYHFKLQACDAVRIQIGRFSRTRKPRLRYSRLCCDACNVHVVWSDQYSSWLPGPHRDTTSSLPFEGQSEETRICCQCRKRSFSLFYCIHLFHYFCCVSLFCQVHLQGEKKYYHVQMMVINI